MNSISGINLVILEFLADLFNTIIFSNCILIIIFSDNDPTPPTLFPASESSALMANSSFLAAAAAASSATSNFQAEAARQFLHQLSASHALNPPSQVDLRESSVNKSELGVWAVESIPQGTRFGPFMGKWSVEPTNPKYAWEVSLVKLKSVLFKH